MATLSASVDPNIDESLECKSASAGKGAEIFVEEVDPSIDFEKDFENKSMESPPKLHLCMEETNLKSAADLQTMSFSKAYEMAYEPSELVLMEKHSFCALCLSETPGKHKSSCLIHRDPKAAERCPESREFLTVNVYKHIPPKVDGCPMSDDQCSACQLSLSPSPSYYLVSLCEKDLNGNAGDCGLNLRGDDVC